jgi:NADH-quinone oxidoreductase subunit E
LPATNINSETIEAEERKQIDDLLKPFKGSGRAVTIQALQAIQEKFGYLSPYAIEKTAAVAGVSPNTVSGVATFYAQFNFTRPARHQIKICQGTACHVCGAAEVFESLERELGISDGQSTPDNKFSLQALRCVGGCALAPVMVIDGTIYGKVTPTKAKEILGQYQ